MQSQGSCITIFVAQNMFKKATKSGYNEHGANNDGILFLLVLSKVSNLWIC